MKRAVLVLLLLATPIRAEDQKPKASPGLVHMSPEQQRTVKLQTAQARRQQITQPVHVPGTVAFDTGHVAHIRPFEQARVTTILVSPGEAVAADQPLAELDMPGLASAQQSLIAAQASIREAEAAVAVARDSLRRAEILSRDGSLSRAEAERRRLVLAQAVAAAEATKARSGALQATITRLNPAQAKATAGTPGAATLSSPISGVVVAINATPGEVLAATADAFTVANLETVLILAQIPESAASQVAVNDPATITFPTSDRQWHGQIATLAAIIDPQSRTLPARIRLTNPGEALRAGMFVDVNITADLDRQSTTVPTAAVQLVADKHVVFTPEGDDRFQAHDVTIGVERQGTTEIKQGLQPGATIVINGSFELKALLQKSMLDG